MFAVRVQVCRWLDVTLGLPQYQHRFREGAVSGPVLLSLTDADLADTLGIRHPLHRRKIVIAVDDLAAADDRVREGDPGTFAAERWTVAGDAEKLRTVVDLKKAFDSLDLNKDGELAVDELATAFSRMGISAEQSAERVRWEWLIAHMPQHAAYESAAGASLCCRREPGLPVATATPAGPFLSPSLCRSTSAARLRQQCVVHRCLHECVVLH